MGRLKGSKDLPEDAISKVCPGCKIDKPFSDFGKNSYNKFELATRCRDCSNTGKRQQNKDRPDILRNQNLVRKFNITIDEYDKMLVDQEGLCAICHKVETQKNMYGVKRLAVDHNHITSRVRGLLCNKCNTGLGLFNTDEGVSLMLDAVEYIRSYDG